MEEYVYLKKRNSEEYREICGWTEYLNGERWNEGKAKIYPVNNMEMSSMVQKF